MYQLTALLIGPDTVIKACPKSSIERLLVLQIGLVIQNSIFIEKSQVTLYLLPTIMKLLFFEVSITVTSIRRESIKSRFACWFLNGKLNTEECIQNLTCWNGEYAMLLLHVQSLLKITAEYYNSCRGFLNCQISCCALPLQ